MYVPCALVSRVFLLSAAARPRLCAAAVPLSPRSRDTDRDRDRDAAAPSSVALDGVSVRHNRATDLQLHRTVSSHTHMHTYLPTYTHTEF